MVGSLRACPGGSRRTQSVIGVLWNAAISCLSSCLARTSVIIDEFSPASGPAGALSVHRTCARRMRSSSSRALRTSYRIVLLA